MSLIDITTDKVAREVTEKYAPDALSEARRIAQHVQDTQRQIYERQRQQLAAPFSFLDLVQRATALLAQSKSHVGAVLNKTRTYVPKRLHQENLGNL